MILALTRRWYADDTTTGTLVIDGQPECFALEDRVRTDADPVKAAEEITRVKIDGQTAIPAGTYRVTMVKSPKFGRVPTLHDVPGFTAIRIHAGTTAKDTAGCLLVGYTRKVGALEQSRVALAALSTKIEAAIQRGEAVTLTIRQAEPSP